MAKLSEREKDLRWLRAGASSKRRRISTLLILFSIVSFLALSGVHLWIAAGWAHLAGLTFNQAWSEWLTGISPDKHYSGLYLKAMEQFDTWAFGMIFVVVFMVTWLLTDIDYRRRARILTWIEEGKRV